MQLQTNNIAPLEIKNFTKRYTDYRGVDNVSIEVKSGEVFGFLGPNGAGKSTTIRTILNFISPTEGTITVAGLDSKKDYKEIKEDVGYLAGDIAVYENMTGRKILEYLTKLGKNTDWNYVEELTERLDAALDRPIRTLSKGNKQKIGLIQAFMHRPNLIILDEPTSGLDPLMKQVFYDMVLEMKEDGKTVFVSSHDLTEVQKICDRAAFIREGKIVSVENIKNSSVMQLRNYIVTFQDKPSIHTFESVAGVSKLSVDGYKLTASIKGSIAPFVRELAKHNPIDLDEQERSLEDMFMHYYENNNKGEK